MRPGVMAGGDAYLAAGTAEGWVVSRPGEYFWAEMKFASEEEMRLTLTALGYERVSGDGLAEDREWTKKASR